MRRTLALAALLLTSARPVDHPRTYLLSIVNLPIKGDDMMDRFHFDTWGVTVNAVCQIPVGWTITAGGSINPQGEIGGHGSNGVTWLRKVNERELRNLLLVTPPGHIQEHDIRSGSGEIPATFKGTVGVVGIDDDPDYPHKRPLTAANIRLRPARACPPIPASRLR